MQFLPLHSSRTGQFWVNCALSPYLLASEVLRTNELEVWFLSEHLVDVPLITATA
jgi:hypothetical protein